MPSAVGKLDLHTLVLAQPGGSHHGADRLDVAAGLADDLAHVLLRHADLDDRCPSPGDRLHRHRRLVVDDVLGDEPGQVGVVAHGAVSASAAPSWAASAAPAAAASSAASTSSAEPGISDATGAAAGACGAESGS